MLRQLFLKLGGPAVLLIAFELSNVFPVAVDQNCYMPGDIVDPQTFFLDVHQKPLRLLDAVRPGTKLVVLVILGGAYLTSSERHGGIWCEDTSDEFANLKAAYNAWKDKGVQFVAVACPPVYSDSKYGYDKNVFLDMPADSPKYNWSVGQFIEKTEVLRKNRVIPFDVLYYDPRFRLLWNAKEHTSTEAYGTVYPWQGKFKWHKDEQRYGTPCIWFLNARGKVLREPLYGNNYSAVPPKILFTYWELEGAIGESLSKFEIN